MAAAAGGLPPPQDEGSNPRNYLGSERHNATVEAQTLEANLGEKKTRRKAALETSSRAAEGPKLRTRPSAAPDRPKPPPAASARAVRVAGQLDRVTGDTDTVMKIDNLAEAAAEAQQLAGCNGGNADHPRPRQSCLEEAATEPWAEQVAVEEAQAARERQAMQKGLLQRLQAAQADIEQLRLEQRRRSKEAGREAPAARGQERPGDLMEMEQMRVQNQQRIQDAVRDELAAQAQERADQQPPPAAAGGGRRGLGAADVMGMVQAAVVAAMAAQAGGQQSTAAPQPEADLVPILESHLKVIDIFSTCLLKIAHLCTFDEQKRVQGGKEEKEPSKNKRGKGGGGRRGEKGKKLCRVLMNVGVTVPVDGPPLTSTPPTTPQQQNQNQKNQKTIEKKVCLIPGCDYRVPHARHNCWTWNHMDLNARMAIAIGKGWCFKCLGKHTVPENCNL